LALPTLVRKLPEPVRKIIGDLSNTEHMLIGLDLLPMPLRNTMKRKGGIITDEFKKIRGSSFTAACRGALRSIAVRDWQHTEIACDTEYPSPLRREVTWLLRTQGNRYLQHPEQVQPEQIVVTPTLIKKLPLPLRKLIGDLSDKDRLLLGLDIVSANAAL
jgi:hypothetical protein